MASVAVVPQFSAEGIGAQLFRLEGAVSLLNLARGVELFAPGDPCDRVFVLLAGRVKLSVEGPGGKSCLLHIVEAGDVVDESALLGAKARRTSATVVERASVVTAPVDSVLRELETRPELWRLLTPSLRTRLRNLEEQLQWVCFLEVEQRVARLLLRWAENQGRSFEGALELRLSQKGSFRHDRRDPRNHFDRVEPIAARRLHRPGKALDRGALGREASSGGGPSRPARSCGSRSLRRLRHCLETTVWKPWRLVERIG